MLPFLLIPVAALLFSLRQPERYESSASVLFRDVNNIASDDPVREAATSVELLGTQEIKRAVSRRLAGKGPIADDVRGTERSGNILTITATEGDPKRAARSANAYASAFVAFRRSASEQKLVAEQRFLRAEIVRLGNRHADRLRKASLRRRLRRLQFDRLQERGGTRIVSAAIPPTTASSPKPVRNTVVGAIVGAFLALLAAVVFERLDPRLRSPQEVASMFQRPLLGLVHKSRTLARSPLRAKPPPAEVDDFLSLRAHLRYLTSTTGLRSVLVTSSAARDGKTTVAWNLALAAAGPKSRVLFVEADLRNPTLGRTLGLDGRRSVASVLDGGASLRDVIQDVALPNENGNRASRVVAVALASEVSTRSTDALAWERLGGALREAEDDFDLIVIDTAPILNVPDAIPLLSAVDGVVVVGRLGSTPRAALARLKEQLDAVGAHTVGVVVNSVGKDTMYGSGYDARPR
jgi:capsular exopolysaccharide synthesis family protein